MVSVEKYKCFCVDGKLERFTSKSGRGFVKCKKETCTMFVPEEKYLDLFHVYENDVHAKFKPNKFPNCHCDEVSSLWVSYSTANHMRPYFRCQDNDEDEKCGFFMWADTVSKLKKKRPKSRKDEKNTVKEKRQKRIVLESSDDE